ncbi:MAG: hypothetical protein BWY95_01290 [Bacteroidetes bacterium ADurb.BinA104]|nr:MAG: hypothetical protein BWY95_01290 [Bacteroidetes bacterium ADurb.BinA104]
MALQNHGNLFKRRVAGPLAHAVDCHLYLTGAIEYSAHCIGGSHSQIIVTMCGENSLTAAQLINIFHQIAYLGAVFIRQTITRSIGYVYYGGAGTDNSLNHAGQIFVIGTAGILGIKFHIIHFLLYGIFYRRHSTL